MSESTRETQRGASRPQAPVDGQRAADQQPDVLLDVPLLKVDEIHLEVDNLQARISLLAEVLNLLRLQVGADVSLGRVALDIKGVEAVAVLKVRLDNVAEIIDRVMTTIDNNPQILEHLTRGLGEATEEIAEGTDEALEEIGGGTARAEQEVGTGARRAVEGVGEGAGSAVQSVGGDIGRAVDELARDGEDTDGTAELTGRAASKRQGATRGREGPPSPDQSPRGKRNLRSSEPRARRGERTQGDQRSGPDRPRSANA